jgi:hypothetical protein
MSVPSERDIFFLGTAGTGTVDRPGRISAGRTLFAVDAAFAGFPRFHDVEWVRDFTARNGTSGSLRDISPG